MKGRDMKRDISHILLECIHAVTAQLEQYELNCEFGYRLASVNWATYLRKKNKQSNSNNPNSILIYKNPSFYLVMT